MKALSLLASLRVLAFLHLALILASVISPVDRRLTAFCCASYLRMNSDEVKKSHFSL
jgi:hypothetical protein